MKTPAFNILRCIIIMNSLCERLRITRKRTAVKGEKEEAAQSQKTRSQDSVLLRVLPQD